MLAPTTSSLALAAKVSAMVMVGVTSEVELSEEDVASLLVEDEEAGLEVALLVDGIIEDEEAALLTDELTSFFVPHPASKTPLAKTNIAANRTPFFMEIPLFIWVHARTPSKKGNDYF